MTDTVTNPVARLVTHHRPALDEVVVFDGERQAELASGPVSEFAHGPGVWDRRLFTLGWRRVTNWYPQGASQQWVCLVEPTRQET